MWNVGNNLAVLQSLKLDSTVYLVVCCRALIRFSGDKNGAFSDFVRHTALPTYDFSTASYLGSKMVKEGKVHFVVQDQGERKSSLSLRFNRTTNG